MRPEPSATVTSGSSVDHKDAKAPPPPPPHSRNDKAHPNVQNAMDSMRRVKTEPSSLNSLSHKEYLERKQREKEKMMQHHQQQKEGKQDRHHLDVLMQQQHKDPHKDSHKDPSKPQQQPVKPHHRPDAAHRHHDRRDPKHHRSHTDVFRQVPSGTGLDAKQELGGKPSHGQYEKSRDSHRTQPNLIKPPKPSAPLQQPQDMGLGMAFEPLPPPEVLMAELTKPDVPPAPNNVAQQPPMKSRPPKLDVLQKSKHEVPSKSSKHESDPSRDSRMRPDTLPAEHKMTPKTPVTPQTDTTDSLPLKSPPLNSPVKANPVVKLEPLVQAVKDGEPIKKKLESGSVDRRLSINMSQLRERYQSESEKSDSGEKSSPPTPKTAVVPSPSTVTNSPLKIKLNLNPEGKEKERDREREKERKESKAERKEKEKIKLKLKHLVGSPGVSGEDPHQARSSPSEGLKVKLDLKRKEVRPASATSTPTAPSGADDYRLNQSANPLKIKISKSSSATPPNPDQPHHHRHSHKSHKPHKSHKHRDRDKDRDREKSHSNGSSHRKRSHASDSAPNSIPHKLQRTEAPANGTSDATDVNRLMHQLAKVIEEKQAAIALQGGQPPLPSAPPAPPPPPPPYPPLS